MSLLLLLVCLATSRRSVFADAAAVVLSPPSPRRFPSPAALAPAITQVQLPSPPPSPVMDPVSDPWTRMHAY